MLYSGTDPESNITKCTLAYEDYESGRGTGSAGGCGFLGGRRTAASRTLLFGGFGFRGFGFGLFLGRFEFWVSGFGFWVWGLDHRPDVQRRCLRSLAPVAGLCSLGFDPHFRQKGGCWQSIFLDKTDRKPR